MSQRKTKRLSGYEYRMKRQLRSEYDSKLSGSLMKFLKKDNVFQPSTSGVEIQDIEPNHDIANNGEETIKFPITENLVQGSNSELGNENDDDEDLETHLIFDREDPGTWPVILPQKIVELLIECFPTQVKNFKFPVDESGRKFSVVHYERRLSNLEVVERPWLFYSKLKNKVFCLYCKSFGTFEDSSPLITGFSDWNHLSQSLARHETSFFHISNCSKWSSLSTRLMSKTTIDGDFQKLITEEKKFWREVTTRLVSVVQFLSRQCLAFRGSSDKVFENNNGNFLKALEAIAKFDPIIRQHLKKVQKNQSASLANAHYLSKTIQNELIEILSKSVLNEILTSAKRSKYFALILDCTPDSSHTEQISVVIRFLVLSEKPHIREHFLGFCEANDTTGEGLFNFVLNKLKNLDLDINNMRGQSYDNGANMKGKHCGLQKRIVDVNPRARFVPCTAHSLNLVVNDAAKVSLEAADFFNIVQQLYCFFSGSTKRWDLIKSKIKISLKPISTTRWESRVDAVRPLVESIGEIYDVLLTISDGSDASASAEARAIATRIQTLEFCLSVVVWYDILTKVNVVSKMLQNPGCDLGSAAVKLGNLRDYFFKLRSEEDESFEIFLKKAEDLAKEVEGNTNFEIKRLRKRKRHFSYEGEDEETENPKLRFKRQFYFRILDQINSSIDERFNAINEHLQLFGIVQRIENLWKMDDETLKKHCQDLHIALQNPDNTPGDIRGDELFEEIKILKTLEQHKTNWTALDVLTKIVNEKLDTSFPNLMIVIRIFLTLPVSVAASERSFSKLKIIKNYLRSSMSQERLSGLSILAIEHDTLDKIELESVVDKFACYKVRKIKIL